MNDLTIAEKIEYLERHSGLSSDIAKTLPEEVITAMFNTTRDSIDKAIDKGIASVRPDKFALKAIEDWEATEKAGKKLLKANYERLYDFFDKVLEPHVPSKSFACGSVPFENGRYVVDYKVGAVNGQFSAEAKAEQDALQKEFERLAESLINIREMKDTLLLEKGSKEVKGRTIASIGDISKKTPDRMRITLSLSIREGVKEEDRVTSESIESESESETEIIETIDNAGNVPAKSKKGNRK